MSLDRSLKGKSTLERHRNVLNRAERIEMLEENDKWTEAKTSVFNLPKVGHRKAAPAKKVKAEATAEGAVAGAAAPAASAKAAPAAAAPAAKGAAKK